MGLSSGYYKIWCIDDAFADASVLFPILRTVQCINFIF